MIGDDIPTCNKRVAEIQFEKNELVDYQKLSATPLKKLIKVTAEGQVV